MLIKAKCVLGIKAKDGRSPIWPGSVAEVDDKDGKRMVELGVAEEISAAPKNRPSNISAGQNPGANPSGAENAQNEPSGAGNEYVTGHLDKDQLQEMSFADLKALAKDMGIDTGKIKSKSGMIEAITAVEVEAPAGDELPDLTPQDVVDE